MAESDKGRETPLFFEAQSDLIMQLSHLRGLLLENPLLGDALQETLYALVEYLAMPLDGTPDSEVITGDG
jgi:hypothetical protein